MREISEYTLIGNYLIFLSEKLGQGNLKYEQAKLFSEKVLAILNKTSKQYIVLPIDDKMHFVKKMISKGVFKTNPSNSTVPFKQVYNFEASKYILATFSADNNLVFKLQKTTLDNKDIPIERVKQFYSINLGLDLQFAMRSVMNEPKSQSFKVKQNK